MQGGRVVISGGFINSWGKREAKGIEGRQRCQLNAEFQGITKRDSLCMWKKRKKEREENNRMGEAEGLFKKTGDIKGTFHAKWSQRSIEKIRT